MDALLDEVESLEAILMDDVKITKNTETGIPEMIETVVLPTVGEETESQYVCITLQVLFTKGYPDVQPKYQLRNPRGLDDRSIEQIRCAIDAKLIESLGAPIVFDLIEVIREHLTHSNLPTGQCVVCLYGFQAGDEFAKTECYHYLHSYCLARHLDASERNYNEELEKLPSWQQKTVKPFEACCPVCREPISKDVNPLRDAAQPIELQNAPDFRLTTDLKSLQVRMANLYMHQMQRGGIIDSNADDTNVISIQSEDASEQQSRKANKKSSKKPQPTEQQLNQARQAAALALRNATMVKNEDEDDEDDDDDGDRRRHGRRGGSRHKNAAHKRNGHDNHHHNRNQRIQQATKIAAGTNNDTEQASGSNKR